jgi:hypothetical protein
MCAGTILEALTHTSSTATQDLSSWDPWLPMPNWYTVGGYTPTWRAGVANAVFQDVVNFVNSVSIFGITMDANTIAAQVVNTFAFNNPWDYTSGWSATPGATHYVGYGSTISPDDLAGELASGWNQNYSLTETPVTGVPTSTTCVLVGND